MKDVEPASLMAECGMGLYVLVTDDRGNAVVGDGIAVTHWGSGWGGEYWWVMSVIRSRVVLF